MAARGKDKITHFFQSAPKRARTKEQEVESTDNPVIEERKEGDDSTNTLLLAQDNSIVDIGELDPEQSSSVLDREKIKYLTQHFRPNYTYEMPYMEGKRKDTKEGSRKRYFNLSWLEEFEWLVFSPAKKGGFCKYCFFFASIAKGFLRTLVKTPFLNFKFAKGKKDGVLTLHDAADYHRQAVTQAKLFLAAYSRPERRIENQLDQQKQQQYDMNKALLSCLIDAVRLCGTQNMALRGHRDDSTAATDANQGNFLAILNFVASYNPLLKEHLDRSKAKYISKTIQNEIILATGKLLQERILEPLKESRFYSIIADEVTDVFANQEVLSVCVRFIDTTTNRPHVKELFLGFLHIERSTGQDIATAILRLLREAGLQLENIRGQAYDGASAMAGSKNGTQAIILRECPKAIFTHCRSHVLNLSIVESCRNRSIRNLMDIISELHYFFHNSPKRQRFMEMMMRKLMPESKGKKVKGLCRTRWVERHEALDTVIHLHEHIVSTLHAMLDPASEDEEGWSWDKETKAKANGLRSSLCNFEYIIALVVLRNVLFVAKGLAVKLQKRDRDIYEAYQMIDFVIQEVEKMRENIDELWCDWFQEAQSMAEAVETRPTVPRFAKMQQHRNNTPAENANDFFRRNIGIPFIENFKESLRERFSMEGKKMSHVFGLVASEVRKMSDEGIRKSAKELIFWESDLSASVDLERELKQWKSFCDQMDSPPENMLESLSFADGDLFPNVRQLLLIGCTSPIGSCEAERSFSTLRRIKTYMRSTMSGSRLSALAAMSIHRNECMRLSTDEISRRFIALHPRRLLGASVIFENSNI